MRRTGAIDLLLYYGIIGTIGVAHSLLLTMGTVWQPTTLFYIITWVTSLVILLWCRFEWKEHEQFDYDEPLNTDRLIYVLFGVTAALFISAILIRRIAPSSIWVPRPQLSLTVGSMNVNVDAVINDLFYQLGLVCNSEETMVLALSQVLRKKLETTRFFGSTSALSALVIPRIGWGFLHAYVAYIGSLQWILVGSAIISGIIISYFAYNSKSRSFLVALLIHFGFNASVILGAAMGLIP